MSTIPTSRFMMVYGLCQAHKEAMVGFGGVQQVVFGWSSVSSGMFWVCFVRIGIRCFPLTGLAFHSLVWVIAGVPSIFYHVIVPIRIAIWEPHGTPIISGETPSARKYHTIQQMTSQRNVGMRTTPPSREWSACCVQWHSAWPVWQRSGGAWVSVRETFNPTPGLHRAVNPKQLS